MPLVIDYRSPDNLSVAYYKHFSNVQQQCFTVTCSELCISHSGAIFYYFNAFRTD
jgi:hypothetical protein